MNSTPVKQIPLENQDQFAALMQDLSITSEVNRPISATPDLPPMEAAFTIDKISQTIFSLLEPKDLLTCRLVSSSWLRMATNDKLLKWNQLKHLSDPNEVSKLPGVRVNGRTRPFKELAHLLNGMSLSILPFFGFTISGIVIPHNHGDLEKLLDRYGVLFKSLRIVLPAKDPKKKGRFFVYRLGFLLEFMTKLLTQQMPNLEKLVVEFEPKAKFAGVIDSKVLMSITNDEYFAGNRNKNLRHVYFDAQLTPHEIIGAVCCLAPKMEELHLFNSLRFWAENKHRLCLLKDLTFIPSLDRLDEIDFFEDIVRAVEGVEIKMLTIMFYYLQDKPDLLPRLTTLVTEIFDRSKHTLEVISLDNMYFSPGTVIPQMPNVKCLLLGSLPIQRPWNWFPKGISIATTFPSLNAICFEGDTTGATIAQFLSFCKNEQVASVKRITSAQYDIDKRVFQTRFPNAVVSRREGYFPEM